MWHEDELPDEDLRSVYGEKAAHARLIARLDHLEKKLAEETRRTAEVLDQREPRQRKE